MTQSTEQERAEFEQIMRNSPAYKPALMNRIGDRYEFDTMESAWQGFLIGMQAARRAQVVPQDWKLVPEVPNRKMGEAGSDEVVAPIATACAKAVAVYQAMVAAAPQPPEAAVKQSLTVEAECMTCSGHGAVGNIMNAEPCPDCTPRGQFSEAAPVVPQFSKVAKQKLDYLLEAGEEITGYAIQNKDGRRGAIDCHGFVYWWQYGAPVQMPLHAAEMVCRDLVGFLQFNEAAMQHTRVDGVQKLYTEHQVRQLLAAHGVK